MISATLIFYPKEANMTVVGNEKQEKKIEEMGQIAHMMFPAIEKIIFKGIFRFCVHSALGKTRYRDWRDIAGEPPAIREKFFKTILGECMFRLKKIGLQDYEIKNLYQRLVKENKKYLRN